MRRAIRSWWPFCQQTGAHRLGRAVQRQRLSTSAAAAAGGGLMAVEKTLTLGKHKALSTFPPPRRRSLNNVPPGSAEARRRRKHSPTACRKTWWRKCVPSDRGIYKDRRVRIIIECPEKRFSTQRPDTFTRTILSPNFKPLAVRRRTIHFASVPWATAEAGWIRIHPTCWWQRDPVCHRR